MKELNIILIGFVVAIAIMSTVAVTVMTHPSEPNHSQKNTHINEPNHSQKNTHINETTSTESKIKKSNNTLNCQTKFEKSTELLKKCLKENSKLNDAEIKKILNKTTHQQKTNTTNKPKQKTNNTTINETQQKTNNTTKTNETKPKITKIDEKTFTTFKDIGLPYETYTYEKGNYLYPGCCVEKNGIKFKEVVRNGIGTGFCVEIKEEPYHTMDIKAYKCSENLDSIYSNELNKKQTTQ